MKNPEKTSENNRGDGGAPLGGGTTALLSEEERKGLILRDAMYRNQPTFEDFKGQRDYPDKVLGEDAERLQLILEEQQRTNREQGKQKDRYAEEIEPVVTYIFNDRRLLPTRESFGFLAHEYDDKCNRADIVLGVERKDKQGYNVFVVDTTTSTKPQDVRNKFQKHAQWHGDVPPHCSYVKYCAYRGQCWREPEAPNFIVGVMPSAMDIALARVQISGQGLIQGREKDDATDFKILSEILEQTKMQLEIIGPEAANAADERLQAKLKDLQAAVRTRLYKICGVEGADQKARSADFLAKYKAKIKEHWGDLTYRNILGEVQHRRTGNAALGEVKAS